MNKYNDAKIYKLIDNTNGNIYIGSTYKTLDERLKQHIKDYKRFINGKHHIVTSFSIIENNDYIIELIELFPCNTKKELCFREGYYIINTECVNRCIAGRTKNEYDEEYRETNKEKISQRNKEYYEANREKISQQRKQNRESKKNSITEINI